MDEKEMLFRKEVERKVRNYQEKNKTIIPGQILFAGSSLMEMFPIEEMTQEKNPEVTVYNRGIGGFQTKDLLEFIELAMKHHQKYIDVNKNLKDAEGNLRREFTIEGMHIKEEGYRAIYEDIMKYVLE